MSKHVADFVSWCRKHPQVTAHDHYRMALEVLEAAQIVALPDDGMVIDGYYSYAPASWAPHLKLPFPQTVFEYTAVSPNNADTPGRLAVCLESEGGLGWMVLSVYSAPAERMWVVAPAVAHVTTQRLTITDDMARQIEASQEAFWQARQAEGMQKMPANDMPAGTEIVGVQTSLLPGMPEGMYGHEEAKRDLSDELMASVQAVAFLGCVNTGKTLVQPRGNETRRAMGKPLLRPHWELTLDGEKVIQLGTGEQWGARARGKQYYRAGHVRNLPDGRTTWVRDAIVRGAA